MAEQPRNLEASDDGQLSTASQPFQDTNEDTEKDLEADKDNEETLRVAQAGDDSRTLQQDDDGDVEKANGDPARQHEALSKEIYSIFTVPQKRAIILTGSFVAWFSPMSGSIYFPALNLIAQELNVSSAKVNITVTTYLIVQGLAPMMIAGFSDKAGRRPAYMICFIIYIIANLALALQNNYYALLFLRMLQSAGSSGTVALAQGLVGDCIVSADRGKYVAYAALGGVLGPTISPIIGGLLSQFAGWHWIFWFLLILSVATFIPLMLFLPETCRKIVGDGSVPPPKTSWNLTDKWRFEKRARNGVPIDEEKLAALRKNHRLVIPNPLSTLAVLKDFEAVLLLLAAGMSITLFYAISTGISESFKNVYGFNELEISLMFLPIGAGAVVSAFTTGKMVDWNFRRHARRLDFPVDRRRQADLTNFPVERARLEIGLPLFLLGAVATVGYGWMMDHKISLAGPVIMLLLLGYCVIAGSQTLMVLMVDIYPDRPATVTAANNLFRCLIGAAASAAIQPMVSAMGNGWAYTVLAVLAVLACAGPLASMRYGMGWRRAKKEKAERRRQEKEEKSAE